MPQDSPQLTGSQLTVLVEGAVQQVLSLTMDILRIGRHPDNGLPLADREVSRDHAELRRGPQGYALTDLGSTNGTSVNDAPLSPHVPYLLHSGDRIKIARFQLVYEAGKPADEPATTSEDAAAPRPKVEVAVAQSADVAEPNELWGSRAIDLADGRARPLTTRRALPTPLAKGPASRYLRYLPSIFSDDDFLGRFLLIIESLWEPLEQRQHYIQMYFDPRTAPASFLGWLGTWVGLAIESRWPENRCRELLAEAMDLYRFRGTLYGLRRMIEVFTGITPEIVGFTPEQGQSGGQPFVFRVRMKLSEEDGVDRALVQELIDAHKPACAGYVLEILP